MKGRPDTGAGGWIHQLATGETTMGVSSKFYKITIDDVPDAIISKQEKEESYRTNILEPTKNQNWKRLREGRSRLYGDFESSEGLCLEEWDPNLHIVSWAEFEKVFGQHRDRLGRPTVPHDWTRYRSCDHAPHGGTCAGLVGAVDPEGDLFLFREHYKKNTPLGTNAQLLVEEMSGNERRKLGEITDEQGMSWPQYMELFTNEEYYASVLDSNSFNTKAESGMLTGHLYNQFGASFSPASGKKVEQMLLIMNQWLAPDDNRTHRFRPLSKDGTPNPAPRVYVLDTLTFFQREALSWVVNEKTGKPSKKNDHLAGSCFQFMVACEPRYFGNKWAKMMKQITDPRLMTRRDEREQGVERAQRNFNKRHNKYTGYE